jgi:colicin import membrane protein
MSSFCRPGKALLLAAWLFGVGHAAAQQPASSRDELVEALQQAKREAAQIESRYRQAQGDCAKQFAVNPCLERARSERIQQLRSARSREVEAGDALRRFDAEVRAREREQRAAESREKQQPPAAVPASRDSPARATAPSRAPSPAVDPDRQQEAEARRRDEAARRQAEARRHAAEQERQQQQRAAERAKKQAETPEKLEQYEQRQREAAAREEEKLREAEKQRERRERRAKEREEAEQKRAAERNQ